MSSSLTINTPQVVQQNTPLRGMPSGSTAEQDNNVKYVPQSLTSAQQAQARQNIGAGTSNFSGSYNDLTDKPEIPTGGTNIRKYNVAENQGGDLFFQLGADETITDGDVYQLFMEDAYNGLGINILDDEGTLIYQTVPLSNIDSTIGNGDDIYAAAGQLLTVRVSLVNTTCKLYITGASMVQPNWNETDTNSPAYIKNKPVMPSNDMPEDYKNSLTFYLDKNAAWGISLTFIGNGSFNGVWADGVWFQANGNYLEIENGCGNKIVTSSNSPYENQGYSLPKDCNIKIICYDGVGTCGLGGGTYQKKVEVFYKVPAWFWDHHVNLYDNAMFNISMSDYSKLWVYNTNNSWWDQRGWGSFKGNIVMFDKEMPTSAWSQATTMSDITDLVAIYIPATRVNDFKTCCETVLYDPNSVDLTTLYSKIVPYDFLSIDAQYNVCMKLSNV